MSIWPCFTFYYVLREAMKLFSYVTWLDYPILYFNGCTVQLWEWQIISSHTLRLLKVNDIFDVQCLKFWYKFVNKKLPNYFRDMFKYNYELHDIVTRSHDRLHLYPTRTSGARNVLRHHIPELLNKFPEYLMDRIKTHSLHSISYHIKCYLIDLYSYDCSIINCYICNNNVWEWQFD